MTCFLQLLISSFVLQIVHFFCFLHSTDAKPLFVKFSPCVYLCPLHLLTPVWLSPCPHQRDCYSNHIFLSNLLLKKIILIHILRGDDVISETRWHVVQSIRIYVKSPARNIKNRTLFLEWGKNPWFPVHMKQSFLEKKIFALGRVF